MFLRIDIYIGLDLGIYLHSDIFVYNAEYSLINKNYEADHHRLDGQLPCLSCSGSGFVTYITFPTNQKSFKWVDEGTRVSRYIASVECTTEKAALRSSFVCVHVLSVHTPFFLFFFFLKKKKKDHTEITRSPVPYYNPDNKGGKMKYKRAYAIIIGVSTGF